MILLVIGMTVFFLIHLLPSLVSFRQSLIHKLGLSAYKGIFALIAAAALVLIVIGKIQADYVALWLLPAWTRYLTILLVFISFILFPAAQMPGNIKRYTRHPMLWGVVFWSIGHLLANGDLSSLVLFGGFLVFALLNMLSANLRGAQLQQQILPLRKDLIVIGAGIGVFIVLFFLHPYLFNARIL